MSTRLDVIKATDFLSANLKDMSALTQIGFWRARYHIFVPHVMHRYKSDERDSDGHYIHKTDVYITAEDAGKVFGSLLTALNDHDLAAHGTILGKSLQKVDSNSINSLAYILNTSGVEEFPDNKGVVHKRIPAPVFWQGIKLLAYVADHLQRTKHSTNDSNYWAEHVPKIENMITWRDHLGLTRRSSMTSNLQANLRLPSQEAPPALPEEHAEAHTEEPGPVVTITASSGTGISVLSVTEAEALVEQKTYELALATAQLEGARQRADASEQEREAEFSGKLAAARSKAGRDYRKLSQAYAQANPRSMWPAKSATIAPVTPPAAVVESVRESTPT